MEKKLKTGCQNRPFGVTVQTHDCQKMILDIFFKPRCHLMNSNDFWPYLSLCKFLFSFHLKSMSQ